MKLTMVNVEEPGKIADFVTSILNMEKNEYQEVLETLSVKKAPGKGAAPPAQGDGGARRTEERIQNQINEKIDKQQREYFLREQLKAIKRGAGAWTRTSAAAR